MANSQTDIDYVKYTVGGMTTHCYSHISARNSNKSAVIFFLTHPRMTSHKIVEPVAHILLREVQQQKTADSDLYIVSFDHRNHGERQIDPKANKTWEEGNDTHAVDMYSMVYGTAQDLSMLIDFLPSYLFPRGRRIKKWGLVGISMGGHGSWLALAKEPRLTLACMVISCPEYVQLIQGRAEVSKIPLSPPYFPNGFLDTVKQTYAGSVPYTSKGQDNPFLGKKIFVQMGGADPLVPSDTVVEFIDKLELGQQGTKEKKSYSGVGHDYPDEMRKDSAKWIAHNM